MAALPLAADKEFGRRSFAADEESQWTRTSAALRRSRRIRGFAGAREEDVGRPAALAADEEREVLPPRAAHGG